MIKKENFFFTTRKPIGPYKFIIQSAKIHAEKLTNKKYSLFLNPRINLDIIAILHVIRYFLITSFFSKEKIILINYKGYNLGRYTIPEIYKNYNVYLSRISFIYESMKCLYINLNILRETLRLNKDNIKAAFIDHCMYRNGLIVSVLSKKKNTNL